MKRGAGWLVFTGLAIACWVLLGVLAFDILVDNGYLMTRILIR